METSIGEEFKLDCFFCGEPIIKMNGQDSDSHCEHHISYVPEIKTDAHIGCHISFHMTNKDYVRRPRREIPKKGSLCFFCDEPIVKMNGRNSDSYIEHHIDGNRYNNVPENRTDAHFGCHMKFHQTGENNSMFGKPSTFKGKHHTEESKEKIGLANSGEKMVCLVNIILKIQRRK